MVKKIFCVVSYKADEGQVGESPKRGISRAVLIQKNVEIMFKPQRI